MWAMIVKEFRQLRRDRRTLAMMIVLPIVMLVVFGYAASFDVETIPVRVVGPAAEQAAPSPSPIPSRSRRSTRRRAGPTPRRRCATVTSRSRS